MPDELIIENLNGVADAIERNISIARQGMMVYLFVILPR